KSDSIAVAELLGARALCYQNPYRDALALRMHFPHEAAARQRSLLRNQRERIEIEIEQEAGEKEE
ncbi:hypothetical protein, partial [Klebsiella pneumoniae]|uniref:hypothetical protein n=1 Tax=Klebsiella pneumoniae TaxID=573 RepID=UPI00385370B6